MIVTFTTKFHADIIMLGDVGLSMLKMMGHSGTVPSAILSDDVPAALQKLETAVNALAQPAQATGDDEEPTVILHNRALPLIELLKSAIKEQQDVMWK